MRTRALLQLSIVLGALATLAYLRWSIRSARSSVYFLFGIAGMIANVATLTLAAEHCPAACRGVRLRGIDVGDQSGNAIGGYQRRVPVRACVRGRLAPLIVVSAAFTAFVLVLIPLFGIERD